MLSPIPNPKNLNIEHRKNALQRLGADKLLGILRLRMKFALRTSRSAQDDNVDNRIAVMADSHSAICESRAALRAPAACA